MGHPHLITVCEAASRELTAQGARVYFTVAGQSLFVGDEAFTKAEEVASLVAELCRNGFSDDDIRLMNVATKVSSGVLSKSSSATYTLSVNAPSMDRFGPLLAIVSARKNCEVTRLDWDYGALDSVREELTKEAVAYTLKTAKLLAAQCGVPLLGIHELSHSFSGLEAPYRNQMIRELESPARMAYDLSHGALEKLRIAHTSTLVATVTARFVVGPFEQQVERSTGDL